MNIYFVNVVELLVNIFESYIIVEFVTKYNDSKYVGSKKYFAAAFTIVLLIINASIFNYISVFTEIMSYISLGIVFIYSIFAVNGKTKQKLLSCIIIMFIIIISNFFTTLIFSMIFNISIEYLISEFTVYRFSCLIISKIILFILTRFLLEIKLKDLKNIPTSTIIFISTVPVLSIITMVIITEASIYAASDNRTIIYMFSAFMGMLIINIIFYILLCKLEKENSIKLENNLLKQKNTLQYEYVKKTEILYEEIRTIKHDMRNHIIYLRENIINKKYEECLSYMEHLITKIDSIQKLMHTDCAAFDTIVNAKFNEANKRNIELSYNIICSLSNKIEDADMITLMGNLLDNAIEACKESSNIKEIQINIKEEKSYLFIEIINTIEKSILKNNPELLSTKIDTHNHGLGIKSIKKIVFKYDGVIKYTENNNKIYCNIMLKI